MDRSLATLLRSLQTSRSFEEAARLLPTATGLLVKLSNPLNVTLLSSQLLSSDTLFPTPVSLAACQQLLSVFYTAALRFGERQEREETQIQDVQSTLSSPVWTRAVIQGADDNSPRWRHLLSLGGLLLGCEGQRAVPPRLPADLRAKLEAALVLAVNLTLGDASQQEPNSISCVAFVLNHTFPLISDFHRAQLDYDLILPELVQATFFSHDGLEHGYWLGTVDADVHQVSNSQFRWASKSLSATRVRAIRTRLLTSSLGPLSRLIAHALESATYARTVFAAANRLAEFSRNLVMSWRHTKLSEVEASEEKEFLDDETLRVTLPALFQLLRDILFAIVICLRSAVGKLITDQILATDARGPAFAIQCLHVLRDTYFIYHRFGQVSSSHYMFVNYTAIDILNQYPVQAEAFFSAIRSPDGGKIPAHPLDRLYDLFFLNTAEHFTLTLTPRATEDLFVNTATAYITTDGDPRLNELYEAAHSVLLAVFAAPQNHEISARHIPFYTETLLQSFPASLTARQFRLAIRSIMRIAGPPSAVAASVPFLQAIVLEMLNGRCLQTTSEEALPLAPTEQALSLDGQISLSEKSVLLLAIIDSLSFLSVPLLEEALPTTADLIHTISDSVQKNLCQRKFWEVLGGGEMDVERAALCVAWWTSRGGRELVLYGESPRHGHNDNENGGAAHLMSGGLSLDGKL